MKISFAKPGLPSSGALVAGITEKGELTGAAHAVDEATHGWVTRSVEAARFEGKKDQTLSLYAPPGLGLSRLLLIGLGKAQELDSFAAQNCGGAAIAALLSSGDATVTIAVTEVAGAPISAGEIAAAMAAGARLRSYRFDKYRTKEKKEDKPSLRKLVVTLPDPSDAKAPYARLDAVSDGVFFSRDLISEPPNVIYPETLAAQAKTLADDGLEIEVLGVKQMHKLGMGALLGVGQGSVRDSYLVTMAWNGAGNDDAPICFCGKGVTFDTGGISIKGAGGMEDMKWDMAGSGVVIGLMKALALRKAKVNAVGVVGLVENMPSGSAQRPGDVVTTMSGQTVEVINTDAEGRLVLADAMWYAQTRFKPHTIVDLATLTGAIIVSLGEYHAGLFSNDDTLSERLTAAGKKVGEPVWRMPMGDSYDKMIKSDIADMKNVGERAAGSITAAQFLQRFIKDTKWAHLDIAGVTWSKKDAPVTPKGATAFGLRLLNEMVADYYEKA